MNSILQTNQNSSLLKSFMHNLTVLEALFILSVSGLYESVLMEDLIILIINLRKFFHPCIRFVHQNK